MPLVFWSYTGWNFFREPEVVSAFMFVSAVLMASRIPTPSLKKIHFPKDKPVYFQMFVVFMLALMALLFTRWWMTLTVIAVGYLIWLPIAIIYFLKLKKAAEHT